MGSNDDSDERITHAPDLKILRLLEDKRKEKGYTIRELGKMIKVSSTYLADVERGTTIPSDYIIRILSKLYDIPAEELFEGLGKNPITESDEILYNQQLLKTVLEIQRSRVREEQKQFLYDKLLQLYCELHCKGGDE